MHVIHQDIMHMATLQFCMLVLALTALLLGAISGERKDAERRLAEEEERVRLIFESTAEGIYGIDAQGVCTFINQAALRILGFSTREQLLVLNCPLLFRHSPADGHTFTMQYC